jgi:hypothetical protein
LVGSVFSIVIELTNIPINGDTKLKLGSGVMTGDVVTLRRVAAPLLEKKKERMHPPVFEAK